MICALLRCGRLYDLRGCSPHQTDALWIEQHCCQLTLTSMHASVYHWDCHTIHGLSYCLILYIWTEKHTWELRQSSKEHSIIILKLKAPERATPGIVPVDGRLLVEVLIIGAIDNCLIHRLRHRGDPRQVWHRPAAGMTPTSGDVWTAGAATLQKQ